MRIRNSLVVCLLIVVIAMQTSPSISTDVQSNPSIDDYIQLPTISPNVMSADTEVLGTMNPRTVEQNGYVSTGSIVARTDTSENTEDSLSIDTTHSWVGSNASVNIWNLTRLYVVNGTFDTGTPGFTVNPNGTIGNYPDGWTAISFDTDPDVADQTQTVAYEDGGRSYIQVQNSGEVTNNPQHLYTHYAGTKVLWNQSIDVTPYTEDFKLSFAYYYASGPLGTGFTGNCSIHAYIDGVSIWNLSLPTLPERETWYETGEIPINIATSSPTMFMLGLVIDEDMPLDADLDYDGDTYPDGIADTQLITVQFDDVKLVGATPPDCDQVDLQFTAGGNIVPVTGTNGNGHAFVLNSSYWSEDMISVSVASNTTVSFEYEAKLKSHRFTNTSWTTDISKEGVDYSVLPNQSIKYEFYTYVGFLGGYENPNIISTFPSDWENITIYDPFLSDVTTSCVVTDSQIVIPEMLIDRLGWWKVVLDGPNYAQSLSTQKYHQLSDSWISDSIFRSGNLTRIIATLGTDTTSPTMLDDVNITWYLPNASLWASEIIDVPTGNSFNSTSWVLSSSNTSAGEWQVSMFWNNGTEIAYSTTQFEIHHRSTLTTTQTVIEANANDVISNMVRFIDNETGAYITGATSVVANWSGSVIVFQPNPIQNWYEADFEIGAIGAGEYIVVVSATGEYFDAATTSFTIQVTNIDNVLALDEKSAQTSVKNRYVANITFKDQFDQGIEEASFDISYKGATNGILWDSVEEIGSGSYRIEFYANISGSYTITISGYKNLYEEAEDVLFLLVTPIETSINSFDSFSCYYGRSYTFEFSYRFQSNATSIEDALVTMFGRGSQWFTIQYLENGNYSVSFTAEEYGSYSIILDFEKYGFELASTSLVFDVEEIPIDVIITYDIWREGTPFAVNVTLLEGDTGNHIESADVTCILRRNGFDLAEWTLDEIQPGVYLGSVTADWYDSGVSLLVRVDKENYHADDAIRAIDTESDRVFFIMSMFYTYLPTGLLFASLISISAVSLRYNRRRNERKRRRQFEIKSQFDDANNILGILILHKKSGLPIYSKILKGGFEEGMISAFITAITHFRTEFGNEGTEEGLNWRITPISDIVRAAPTQNLICAFITLSSPSAEQEAKMLVFTHAIGMKLDDLMEMPPSEVLDDRTHEWITGMFDKHLDGHLLKLYHITNKTKIGRKYRCVREAIAAGGFGEAFTLVEMTRGLLSCGVDEGEAYKLILDAIDEGILLPASI